MEIKIPEYALVVLMGASGSGKSTFAKTHFKATEILSSDFFRGMVWNDDTDQASNKDAFEVLHFVLEKRLKNKLLTVIDATNVQQTSRKELRILAKRYHAPLVGIVLDMPADLCISRNEARPDRNFGPHVVRKHVKNLRHSSKHLKEEGFRHIFKFQSLEDLADVQIVREKLHSDRKAETGPFDLIGDVHGCIDELKALLTKLG
ncbi:MAG: AAA family ATPase, partial [Bacteroidota bacterium]